MDTTTQLRTLSMSTLMNEPVRNMQGQNVGKVEDYMIDLERGCVEYAVLSFGGFLGIGQKLFAIPWDSMQLDTENQVWLLDVSKERLQDAPGFDRENWPDLGDTDYRRSISTFWTVNTAGTRGEAPYQGVRDTERDYGTETGPTMATDQTSQTGQMYGRRRDDMPYGAPGQGGSAMTSGYTSAQQEGTTVGTRDTTGMGTEDRPYGRRRDDY